MPQAMTRAASIRMLAKLTATAGWSVKSLLRLMAGSELHVAHVIADAAKRARNSNLKRETASFAVPTFASIRERSDAW